MNFDFKSMYAIGQMVRIIDEDDTVIIAKIVKITSYCVHCQSENDRIVINRNDSGEMQIVKTKKEISIEIVN